MVAIKFLTPSQRALPRLRARTLTAPSKIGGPAGECPNDDGMRRAMAHLARCDWLAAYAELVLMADAGHPEASRMALLMRAHGTRLFGGRFSASKDRLQRWRNASTGDDDAA